MGFFYARKTGLVQCQCIILKCHGESLYVFKATTIISWPPIKTVKEAKDFVHVFIENFGKEWAQLPGWSKIRKCTFRSAIINEENWKISNKFTSFIIVILSRFDNRYSIWHWILVAGVNIIILENNIHVWMNLNIDFRTTNVLLV